jgi:hypothetical protein
MKRRSTRRSICPYQLLALAIDDIDIRRARGYRQLSVRARNG